MSSDWLEISEIETEEDERGNFRLKVTLGDGRVVRMQPEGRITEDEARRICDAFVTLIILEDEFDAGSAH